MLFLLILKSAVGEVDVHVKVKFSVSHTKGSVGSIVTEISNTSGLDFRIKDYWLNPHFLSK